MSWVFDKLVAWLLERLLGVFDAISDQVLSVFKIDLSVFNTFFSFFVSSGHAMPMSLYDYFKYIAFSICVLLVSLRLLQNLMVPVTEDYEDPIKLVVRAIVAVLLVAYSQPIVQLAFNFVQVPYAKINKAMSLELKGAKSGGDNVFKQFGDSLCAEMTGGGADDSVVVDIIVIACLLAIFFGYIKLTLEAAERYVVIALSLYMSPLAFSTVSTKGTAKIFHSFLRMVFSELLLMIFNIVFVRGTSIAIYNYVGNQTVEMANGDLKVVTGFSFCVLLLAFIGAGQKMDAHMKAIGLDVVQTGSMLQDLSHGCMQAGYSMRGILGASRAAGGFGKAVVNGINTMRGQDGSTSAGGYNRAGRHASAGGLGGAVNNVTAGWRASRDAAKAQKAMGGSGMAGQMNAGMYSAAQTSAQNQIKSGVFDGTSGAGNNALRQAVSTALGAEHMQGLGIKPDSLTGKGSRVNFETQNGSKGTLMFDMPETGGWKQLRDAEGKPMNAYVTGDNKMGLGTGAPVGCRQEMSAALGAKAAETLAQEMNYADHGISEICAVTADNSLFNVVGTNADGNSQMLGKIVSADLGGTVGAHMLENEYGGQAAFIPATDISKAMSGMDASDGMIRLGENCNVAQGDIAEALDSQLAGANIASGTAMVGFHVSADGSQFTASYADPVYGSKDLSGSIEDLKSTLGTDRVFTDAAAKDARWIGFNEMFDLDAYTTITGTAPKAVEFDSDKGSFTISNEDGSTYSLEQAGLFNGDFKKAKFIEGREAFANSPFVMHKSKH